MYNHRKLKSTLFLQESLYPEKILSRHKHHKKARVYASLRSRLLPVNNSSYQDKEVSSEKGVINSKVLLEGIPKLYCFDHSPTRAESIFKEKQATLAEIKKSSNLLTKTQQTVIATKIETASGVTRALPKDSSILLDQRGLQEMEDSSLTNGLLESGHRYLGIS